MDGRSSCFVHQVHLLLDRCLASSGNGSAFEFVRPLGICIAGCFIQGAISSRCYQITLFNNVRNNAIALNFYVNSRKKNGTEMENIINSSRELISF